MSRISEQMTLHELESLLFEIEYQGYVVVPLRKLYRLLGAGNRAKGTWRTLLDVWEEIGFKRESLSIADLGGEQLLLTTSKPVRVVHKDWADEVD